MPYKFIFPDVGEGIHEGTIVKWFVKEGDKVKADQPLGEIETDKAIVEMPCPKTGIIGKIHVKEGQTIHVGEVMVTILLEGEKKSDIGKKESGKGHKKEDRGKYTGSVVGFLEEAKEVQPIVQSIASKKEILGVKAAPAVRNLAKQLGIELAGLSGTGPECSITIQDVKKASESRTEKPAPEQPGVKVTKKYDFYGYVERRRLHGIEKKVADRMTKSLYTAPQVTNMSEADVTELSKLRDADKSGYEKEGIKMTYMPYIVKAVQKALGNSPYLNASLEGDEIVMKKYYNIG